MFPITVTHTREIDHRSSKNYQEYIRQELQKLEVSEISTIDNTINFRINFFSQGRNHPMGVVDKGYFEVDPYSQKLVYSYSTLRIFCITLGMSIALGCFLHHNTGFGLFGVIGFLWIYGMNWLFTYIRQRKILKKMVEGLKK